MRIINFLKAHLLIFIFALIYLSIGIFVYKDYGASGDEWTERRAVENLYRYITRPTTYETIVDSKYHDPISYAEGHHPLITKYQRSYQLLQYMLNSKGYYEWDHLINIGFGLVIFICTYFIFFTRYRSSYKAIIPVVILFLTPRLLGDIPTNNKDVPFALMYLLCTFGIYWFSIKKSGNNYVKIIVLGILFGLTETFRAIGFSIYFVYLLYNLYIFVLSKSKINLRATFSFCLETFIIGIFSFFITIAIFPWLGSNFFANLYELLLNSKNFQNWDDTIFFAGQFLFKNDRPWYYLFTWFLITTPLSTLGLIFASPFYIKRLVKNEIFAISIISILVNFILYLILQPVIYNGLRHFLFLVPMLAIAASTVLITVFETIKVRAYKIILIALLSLNAGSIIYNLVMLHPYEYIYFNEAIGGLKGAYGKYELGYWGASYKEATEWLIANRTISKDELIYACNVDYAVDYYSQKKFAISFGNPAAASYIICDSENQLKTKFAGTIIYEVRRQGVPINMILERSVKP